MTKPAKPGSLRQHVESRVCLIEGYESIDNLPRKVTGGKKADYLLCNKSVIVEQKEFLNSPQHNKRGENYQEYSAHLFQKYAINPNTQDLEYFREQYKLLSPEETLIHNELRNAFYDKIKDNIHSSNAQIASTKRILGLPNAIGVVLMLFDRVNGIMPAVINERVERAFNLRENGKFSYEHVEVFIYSIRLKDLLYNDASCMNGYVSRDSSGEKVEYARKILDALRVNTKNPRPRATPGKDDFVRQLVPNVFSD